MHGDNAGHSAGHNTSHSTVASAVADDDDLFQEPEGTYEPVIQSITWAEVMVAMLLLTSWLMICMFVLVITVGVIRLWSR